MKHYIKLLAILAVFALVFSMLAPFAHAEGSSYTVPDNETEVHNYDFADKSYTSVTIPASVTTIGIGIFRDFPNLQTITVDINNPVYYSQGNCIIEKATGKLVAGCGSSVIPDTVSSIGDYAFYSSPSLTRIHIPDSVRYIGKQAFSKCTALEEMHLPDSVLYIDDQVFNECTSLKELTLSNSLTYLPVGMCYKCSSLEKLVIPPSVTSVEGNIFQGASLSKGVYIHSGIKNVTDKSFNNHRYTPFYYEGTFNDWKKIEAYLDPLFTDYIQEGLRCCYPYEEKLVYVDDNISFNVKVVHGEGIIETVNYAIGDVVIPSEVEGYPITKIEIAAFAAKPSLTSVTFPDTVVQLGNRCFYNSDNLTEIVFPEGIKEIPDGFLLSCDGITDIEIPDTVTTIGASAFSGCSNIKEITVPDSVVQIKNSAFRNCTSLEKVHLPESCITFGKNVFDSTPSLKSIRLPENIKYIPSGMFTMSALEEITIPNGVSIISTYAFSGTNLKNITIPGSVNAIGAGAFGDCPKLESVIVEEGCTELYPNAFAYCPALTSITLPSTLKMVDSFAFSQSALISNVCYSNNKPAVKIYFPSDVVESYISTASAFTFDCMGGSAVSPVTDSIFIDAPYSAKDGYVLAGWSLSPDENAPLVKFPFYSNKDVTLYAKWIERDACIIMTIDKTEASVFGKQVTNDVAPIIERNRTMLPVRFVAESLGAKVEWINEARYIRITGADGRIIDMRVDENGVLANGTYATLDVSPFVRNNRTYTPVRFIAESLGATVLWNQQTKEVAIVPSY